MSSGAFAQHIRYIEDTLHYCLTEPLAKFFVKQYRQNEIHSAQVINLRHQLSSDSIEIAALEKKLILAGEIESEQDTIIDISEQQRELSDQELKRQHRRASWQKVWAWGKYVLIAAGAGGAGYAIGSLAP